MHQAQRQKTLVLQILTVPDAEFTFSLKVESGMRLSALTQASMTVMSALVAASVSRAGAVFSRPALARQPRTLT